MAKEYFDSARSDAKDTVLEFIDDILESLVDNGEASDDLYNDYSNGDSYHHESHVDRDYDLLESAQILDELRDYEETDSGLWEGLEPRRAIAAQAAYTYGNAVYSMWSDLIKEINEDGTIQEIYSSIQEIDDSDEDDEDADEKKSALAEKMRARIKELINE